MYVHIVQDPVNTQKFRLVITRRLNTKFSLKKNERCAQAHYFIGQIAKLCGDAPAAVRSFQKCLQIQPDHVEAQREIRLAQKK